MTNLANVQVRAVCVDVGVVGVEYGGVDALRRGDNVACIVWSNDVGGLAVLAGSAKAKHLTGHEVVTALVDDLLVHSSELPAIQSDVVLALCALFIADFCVVRTSKHCWRQRWSRKYHPAQRCRYECSPRREQL